MKVYSIPSFGAKQINNIKKQSRRPKQEQNKEIQTNPPKHSSKSFRNAALAMCMLPIIGAGITSCEKEDDCCCHSGNTHACHGTNNNNYDGINIDSLHLVAPTDIVKGWLDNWHRPEVLDSIGYDAYIWDIDGAGIGSNPNDSTAKRNITHYEMTREWEYNNKEIGDISTTESTRKVQPYNFEILDYKGRHESYGKRIFRTPEADFQLEKKDGTTVYSPKGFIIEEYISNSDKKNPSVYDCTLTSRIFAQNNGDTLYISKIDGTNRYVETGKAAKGELGANTVLLKNMIGIEPTDDHLVNCKVEAVNDKDLKILYLKQMDRKFVKEYYAE